MTLYCKYHPLDTAAWHCPACRILCCEQCSPERPGDAKGVPHYCAMCGGELVSIGGAQGAVPFWQRPLDFLLYPVSPVPVGLLALGAVLPFLCEGMVLAGALVAFMLVACKYAYTALEYTASERLQPIGLAELAKAENTELALNLGALLAVLVGAVVYVDISFKSVFLAGCAAAVAMAVVPAMIMAAAVDRNIKSAFSGESLKTVLGGIGAFYPPFVIMLLLVLLAVQSFVSLFADILEVEFSRALAVMAYGYLLIVLMTACGYMLFQFQAELGFTPALGRQRARRNRGGVLDMAATQVDIYLKEGAYAKALGVLRNESNRKGATLTAHERYHRLITVLGDEESLRAHANVYFKLLLEGNRDMQLLGLMREYLRRDSGFRPDDPDVCLDVAEAFLNMGEYKMAVHMVNGLHKDAPHFIRLPEAYLMAARVLDENLGMPQKSLALIQYLEGRFKTHKAFPEVMAYKTRLLAKTR